MHRAVRVIWSLVVLVHLAAVAQAADFYVAAGGAGQGDGSQAAPFANVRAALRSGKVGSGDRLLLLAGNHGALSLLNQRFDPPLTIMAAVPGQARVERISFGKNLSGVTVDGLNVWPSQPQNIQKSLVSSLDGASDIVVRNLDVRGRADGDQWASWDLQRWLATRADGIFLRGPRSRVENNRITGINFGIMTSGADAQVIGNVIEGFSGDGLRGLGNNNLFRGNLVRDCVDIDANHDDGFQSWSPKKRGPNSAVSGLTIEGNMILEWTGPRTHPLRCKLQGIGMFDGFYDNVMIRNNLIAVSHFHGITVFGGRGVTIANNTVVNLFSARQPYPWIQVKAHKNGTAPSHITVANNLAMAFDLPAGALTAPWKRLNAPIVGPRRVFMDADRLNYSPHPKSGYMGAGDMTYAPPTDILGRPRPSLGQRPALGAYEGPDATGWPARFQ
jgi:hypothetical protein